MKVELNVSTIVQYEKQRLAAKSAFACPSLAMRNSYEVFCRSDDWCLFAHVQASFSGPSSPGWNCYFNPYFHLSAITQPKGKPVEQ